MYLVTGATGNVGSGIARKLIAEGQHVRLFLRDPQKVKSGLEGAELYRGDFSKPETFRQGLTGIERVFLMNRGPDENTFGAFVNAAREQGVEKIVFLSSLAALNPAITMGKMHKDQEDALRNSGIATKCLRPGGFMTNTLGWIRSIKSEGKVYNAMGSGRFAPVAPDDIAAVGFRVLMDDLAEENFPISGDEVTSVREQTAILSDVLGKPLECVDISLEEAVASMVKNGFPPLLASAVAESFRDIREGRTAPTFDTVAKVTGSRPKSFRSWVEENISAFS